MSKKGKTESAQQVEVLLSFVRDCKKYIPYYNGKFPGKLKIQIFQKNPI